MIERVVENWLTRANELSFQVPFCQMLAGEGYQVVHLSRHGPAEQGKDVLAIDPSGTPCAFQLKSAPSEKITLKIWEKGLAQINRLVEIPIEHPSIDKSLPRRVFFVTNGDLDEEVRVEIQSRNDDWQRRGHPRLETVVKGQLLGRFLAMHTNFWPRQLSTEKTLLELFLADGTDYLPKGKFAQFILELLPLTQVQLGGAEPRRALASTAIFTAYALSPHSEKSNHVAITEGWTVFVAGLAAFAEERGLQQSDWNEALSIASFAIEQALEDLHDELKNRSDLVEGEAMVDEPFYRGRVTWLVGLASAYALWKRLREPGCILDNWFKEFLALHLKDIIVWGEGAIPQWLAAMWLMHQTAGTMEPDQLLFQLIDGLCRVNEIPNSSGLPDPYHPLPEVALQMAMMALEEHGIHENAQEKERKYLQEKYQGRSYVLDSMVQLYARRNFRQAMQSLWPRISRIAFAEHKPDSIWQFCLWHSEEGTLQTTQPKSPQSWSELRAQADLVDSSSIPGVFREHPELLLLFVLTYPHRLTPNVAKFLDDALWAARSKRT